jgi:protein-tyrosine phosphatase
VVLVCWFIDDGQIPDTGKLGLIVDLVTAAIGSSKVALVHGAAGINRSGLINALVVRKYRTVSGREALDTVREACPGAVSNADFARYVEAMGVPT